MGPHLLPHFGCPCFLHPQTCDPQRIAWLGRHHRGRAICINAHLDLRARIPVARSRRGDQIWKKGWDRRTEATTLDQICYRSPADSTYCLPPPQPLFHGVARCCEWLAMYHVHCCSLMRVALVLLAAASSLRCILPTVAAGVPVVVELTPF